jgi:phosphoribosylanthranilate isomerase
MFNSQSSIIKICGMTDAENIREVEKLNPTMMGFIFYEKSPRYCQVKPSYLPTSAKRVGVFVDADITYIKNQMFDFQLDYVQLHGNETPAFCQELKATGIGVIKAIGMSCEADLWVAEAYINMCDYLLFDTKTPKQGGSGKQFNWNLLSAYKGPTPFLLSGGIGPEDAEKLQQFHHPMLAGYDLNSKFESSPGIKNVPKLKAFLVGI